MKKWLFLFFLLAGVGWCEANGLSDQFFQANQRYAEGHYQEAVKLYEEILRSGLLSGPLYYNLGNAYFKLDQPGRAILNYERARRLMPQDEDLLSNLYYVTSLLEQAQPADDLRGYERVAFGILGFFSVNGWVIVLLVIYTLLGVSLLVAIFIDRIKNIALRSACILTFLVVTCSVFTLLKIYETGHRQEGVILQKIVDVRYSPALTGAVAFRLHEGIRAQVVRQEGNWVYIRLSRDKSGWVERATIEGI